MDSPSTSRKRKVDDDEKTVVRVKIEPKKKDQKLEKNIGPPPDSWSWRKYGQKPVSGSPYTRGYYRCSTVKGCSAKKQVERCKDDASVLVITYISSHNHPSPNTTTPKSAKNHESTKKAQEKAHSKPESRKKFHNSKGNNENSPSDQGHHGHYSKQSPKHSSNENHKVGKLEEEEPYVVTLDTPTPYETTIDFHVVNDEQEQLFLKSSQGNFSFLDELDELDFSTPTSFTTFDHEQ